AAGVSCRTLSRWFPKVTGMTVLDFIQKRRVALACHYLATSDRSSEEIAFESGTPVSVNGQKLSPAKLVEMLNALVTPVVYRACRESYEFFMTIVEKALNQLRQPGQDG
ncbi:MAG: helix-turn-helix domain-containing protein, partial [Syntrophaceae bacterium]|nr:helix-turn-helix domain-containing protein [Syntrophaceae bacterium]